MDMPLEPNSHPPVPLLMEESVPGRCAGTLVPAEAPRQFLDDLPAHLLRSQAPALPELSELQVVRHFTRLSQRNFSVDTNTYPLGSCTMKYNPRAAHAAASLEGFATRHPHTPDATNQGLLACLFELQQLLAAITGLPGVSLAPMGGAQGELAALAMMAAWHRDRGDGQRTEVLVPNSAHGTNPASAAMCGLTVREIATTPNGDVDPAALAAALSERTAVVMLTNPSTLGTFERGIVEIASLVHGAGALFYYDGANLNAILGRVRPADMGFDALHLNLHKTFATPHGGGGPGAGPVAVSARLAPYLPLPHVLEADGTFRLATPAERPQSIGPLGAFLGNVGVQLRAYAYLRLLGTAGLARVSGHAVLNASYVAHGLTQAGYRLAYPKRRACHEFVVTLAEEAQHHGFRAGDVAKRMLDFGIYAPTVYFPLLVSECLLIEPTETETRDDLDRLVAVMGQILAEGRANAAFLQQAPHLLPISRVDEVAAARHPVLTWRAMPESGSPAAA